MSRSLVVYVKGMSCRHCKAAVEKAVGAVPGVREVRVDLPSGEVRVTVADAGLAARVAEAIGGAGYEVVSWREE
ncbi:MAG: cation transporter [Bacillota bacterium]|nr:cation transporter [Bacillota bacterium]